MELLIDVHVLLRVLSQAKPRLQALTVERSVSYDDIGTSDDDELGDLEDAKRNANIIQLTDSSIKIFACGYAYLIFGPFRKVSRVVFQLHGD